MSTESDHQKYRKQRFELDVDGAVFSAEELDLLAEYGTWLTALENGVLEPITNEQRRFLLVANEHAKPSNDIQAVWLKYKRRKAALEEMSEVPHYHVQEARQQWYSDADYRKGIHFPKRPRR